MASPPGQEDVDGLAQFETGKLDVSGQWNNDGSLEVDLCLKSMSLDDVREHSSLAVKRFVYVFDKPMMTMQFKKVKQTSWYSVITMDI